MIRTSSSSCRATRSARELGRGLEEALARLVSPGEAWLEAGSLR
jgi:hypothetical protein